MFVQALQMVIEFLPAWTFDRFSAPTARLHWWRRRRSDRFIRGLPPVSQQWLVDHDRIAGKDGDRP